MSGHYPLYVAAAYPAAGGNITVEEVDGNPSHNVHTLIFPNGSVSIQGTRATITLAGSGDMVLASAQTVTGAKTFNDSTLLLANVAGTFSSKFTNTNTAARTYTLPNATGTVALTSDIGVTVTELDGAPSAVCTSLVFPTGAVSIASGVATLVVANASHVHGNILNDGRIGSTENLPLITTTGGVITVGTFGTTANSFCQGNDSRLSDARTPTAHNQAWSTITSTPTTLSGYGITDAASVTHVHPGSDITSGTVDPARLGSGTSIATKFLRGDSTWQSISGGGDALVANTLDQFADVTQTGGATLTITSSTTLSGGDHSGTNTGDNATNSQYSGLVSNATHTGDVTGATALTIKTDVALAGNPTTTTQAATDTSTRIATTAHVKATTSRLSPFKIDTTTAGAKKLYYPIPFACTITGWEMVADVSGSVVVDIWSDSFANYPPAVGDTITGSAKPTISSSNKASSTTLTGWTTALPAGHYLEVNVDSVTTITNVTLTLTVTRT